MNTLKTIIIDDEELARGIVRTISMPWRRLKSTR